MAQLYAELPSFAAVIEQKNDQSGLAQIYPLLKDIDDVIRVFVGFKSAQEPQADAGTGIALPLKPLKAQEGLAESSEEPEAPEPIWWVITPSADHRAALVNWHYPTSKRQQPTFTGGDWEQFVCMANRTLVAMNFQLEIIR